MSEMSRFQMPFGANVVEGGVRFAVWAPKATRVDVEILGGGSARRWRLAPQDDGVFAGFVAGVSSGARYLFCLDDGPGYPDPWSRSQPDGVHGPSEVVDPSAFRWTDARWRGVEREQLTIYEVHVGTYTSEGTFGALARELPEIQRLGVTAVEIMPVAEFPGRRNWGYDGVCLYAPSHVYGGGDALKNLVDTAHRLGMAVILDVVYNHLGPDGNYLGVYSDDFFTDRYTTPWGDALNYDGPNCQHVRAFVVQNACYWLREFHLDGLRLDATHAIFDHSPTPLLAEIADAIHAEIGSRRRVYLFAEDERNDVALIRPRSAGGMGFDGIWADDFHHATHTLLTGEREGYYVDYDGSAQALARTIDDGLLYQGQQSAFRGSPRGTKVADEPATSFVFCIENHDQVGNRAFGERLNHLVDRDEYAVASTLLLLAPEIPLLFMGQEFAASSPFLYFTDHSAELGRLVTAGRRREFARFSAFADEAARERIPDPQAEETFRRSKLILDERQRNADVYNLYHRLLWLRRSDPVFRQPDRRRAKSEALGERCVIVRRWAGARRRLILANFGAEIVASESAAPLLDWLDEGQWRVLLSTRRMERSTELAPNSLIASSITGSTRTPSFIHIPAKTAMVWASDTDSE